MISRIKPIILILFFHSILQSQPFMYNTEFQVNTYTDGAQSDPTIGALYDGGFVICWASRGQDGSDLGVYAQIYNSEGTKYGEEFQANTYTNYDQYMPSACGSSKGTFLICWSSHQHFHEYYSNYGVFGQLYENNGTKIGQEFEVSSLQTTDQHIGDICSLLNGNFVVCWQGHSSDGDGQGVLGRIYDSSGGYRSDEFIINSVTSGHQRNPCISDLVNGGFVVCWESGDGSSEGIFGQVYDSIGTKLGEQFQVNTYTIDSQLYPCVANLSDGGFMVCWESKDQDGDEWGIYGQLFNSSFEKQGDEFQVNSEEYDEQRIPTVCSLADSGFAVFWQSYGQDASYSGIFGQLYNKNGENIGPEFQVNDYTYSYQTRPKVARLEGGGFVICWSSLDQDGSGVFGKYYLDKPILHDLQPFSLQSPTNDETLYSTIANFQWQQPSTIHKNFPWEIDYTLYLDSSEDFENPQIYSSIYDTVFSPNELIPGQTYFWKVLAKNFDGDSLWSSETFGFYVDPAANIEDDPIMNPETFRLFKNYPNPFNPSTVISYQIPVITEVELSVYNRLGQKVVTLVSGHQNSGYHHVQWDATEYASGIYYYRIEAGSFLATQKMLLLK